QEVFQEEHVAELKQAGIPVVSVNGGFRQNIPLICDNVSGAFQGLTRHLMDRGHRRIFQLVSSFDHLPPERARTISQRMAGFRQAMEMRGKWLTFGEEEFFANWPELS